MFDWCTKRKERKAAKEREAKERYKAAQKAADDSIAQAKAAMLEMPCPINDNEKCSEECVHFCNGYAFYMPSFHPPMPGYWHKEWPKCRLWCSR